MYNFQGQGQTSEQPKREILIKNCVIKGYHEFKVKHLQSNQLALFVDSEYQQNLLKTVTELPNLVQIVMVNNLRVCGEYLKYRFYFLIDRNSSYIMSKDSMEVHGMTSEYIPKLV